MTPSSETPTPGAREIVELMARAIQEDDRDAFTAEWPWPDPLYVALSALEEAGFFVGRLEQVGWWNGGESRTIMARQYLPSARPLFCILNPEKGET